MFDRPTRPSRRATLAVVGAILLIPLAAAIATAQDDTVVITSTLEPASLEVTPGTSVTWRNDDAERHRIRSDEAPEDFDSGNLDPGESFTFTFALEGTYPYVDERDDENPAYFGTVVVTSTPDGGTAAPAELATSGTVTIGDRVFIPPTLEVATGSTVEFTNADSDTHTATASDGDFDSGILAPGDTFSTTFDQAGSIPFFCAVHPEMQGTITVTDPVAVGSAAPDPAASLAPASLASPAASVSPSPSASASASPSASPSGSPEASPSASPSGSPSSSPSTSASPAAGASSTGTVSIVDRAFDPPSVEVQVGGTVDWTNDDVDGHTVTADDGSFDSGIVAPGAAFSGTFDTAGAFDYFCAIHPDMVGTVVVTDAAGTTSTPGPSPSPPAAGG